MERESRDQEPRKGEHVEGQGDKMVKQQGCCIHSKSLQNADIRENKITCIQQIMSVVRTASHIV